MKECWSRVNIINTTVILFELRIFFLYNINSFLFFIKLKAFKRKVFLYVRGINEKYLQINCKKINQNTYHLFFNYLMIELKLVENCVFHDN
jgi:hypothetical protein